jgi:UDP-3-O-[3-hydroxymyristoyl] glucosamine N-acyltransferase
VRSPPIRLAALAEALGRSVEGDAEVEIGGVAELESATPGDLVYVRSERYAKRLAASRAAAVIAPPGLDTAGLPAIRSPNPRLDFARAVRQLMPADAPQPGVHGAAHVDPGARVDATACVGPGCVIGADASIGPGSLLHPNVSVYAGVTVGADCVIHAGSVLREGTVLGDRVVLQPGVVLGGDGFGYVRDEEGRYEAVPQIGRVVVEDDVEIGANSAIDRGALGDTRIGRGTKIDNLVQVAHNCELGEDVLIVAQAGLAGSATVERGAMLLAQAGVPDHVRIGEQAYVGPQTGVSGDVAPGARVLGTPHADLALTRRIWVALRRLPDLFVRLRAIERRLGMRGRGGGADAK